MICEARLPMSRDVARSAFLTRVNRSGSLNVSTTVNEQ